MLIRFLEKIHTALDDLVDPKSPVRLSDYPGETAGSEVTPEPVRGENTPHFIKFAARGQSEARIYPAKDFCRIMGHTYLPELEFENETTLRRIRTQCEHALKHGCIDVESRWLGALHAKQIRSHYVADVSIRWIDETLGYGLFAEKDIRAWEYIGEYTGVVRKLYLIFRNYNHYCFSYPTSDLNSRKHIVDSRDKGNELRYANHSDDPNCESIGVWCDGILHIIVRAIKNIRAHTQITYSYADWYWQTRTPVPNRAATADSF